jgi:hypothetical protein
MHSTVQTGIYSPNMFGYDHHHNPHHYGGNFHHHHGRAPSPDRRLQNNKYHAPNQHNVPHSHDTNGGKACGQHHHHTNGNQQHQQQHPRTKLGIQGCSSTNVSLLAIDVDGLPVVNSQRLNASTSNISRYASNKNLDVANVDETSMSKKNSLTSGVSATNGPAKIFTSVQNLSRNVSSGNFNEYQANNGSYVHRSSLSQSSYHKKLTVGEKVQEFLECSVPCGFVTAVLGCILLIASCVCFLLFYESNLCSMAHTCENQLVKISAVMALVFGIVFAFIGFVIVVYSKKDMSADVIITSAKNIGRMGKSNFDASNPEIRINKETSNLSAVSAQRPAIAINNKHQNEQENQKPSDPLLTQQHKNSV